MLSVASGVQSHTLVYIAVIPSADVDVGPGTGGADATSIGAALFTARCVGAGETMIEIGEGGGEAAAVGGNKGWSSTVRVGYIG